MSTCGSANRRATTLTEDSPSLRKIAEAATRLRVFVDNIAPGNQARIAVALVRAYPSIDGLSYWDQAAADLRSLLDQLQEKDATIERLREALTLAAGRLHWAATANPGVASKDGQALVLGWEAEVRAALEQADG